VQKQQERANFEESRSSKLETTAARKKAKLDMAADCVQHKWCLLAKSCGMDDQVQKIVEAKMSVMLEKVEEEKKRSAEEKKGSAKETTSTDSTTSSTSCSSPTRSSSPAPTGWQNSPTSWQRSQLVDNDVDVEGSHGDRLDDVDVEGGDGDGLEDEGLEDDDEQEED
jgi:hypothetical protein